MPLNVVGAVDNFPWERAALWRESLRRHVPEASVCCVAYNLAVPALLRYRQRKIAVQTGNSAGNHVVIRRFNDWAGLVARLRGPVLLTDVRDIIFQQDPTEKLEALLADHDIVVQEEPQDFRRGHFWCEQNLRAAFPEYAGRLLDHPVICAGMIAGKGPELSRLCGLVYKLCLQRPKADHHDQAALNVLLRLGPAAIKGFGGEADFKVAVLPHHYPFCYHSAFYLGHREHYLQLNATEPQFRDAACHTADGQKYAILHLCGPGGAWADAINRSYQGKARYSRVRTADNYQKNSYL